MKHWIGLLLLTLCVGGLSGCRLVVSNRPAGSVSGTPPKEATVVTTAPPTIVGLPTLTPTQLMPTLSATVAPPSLGHMAQNATPTSALAPGSPPLTPRRSSPSPTPTPIPPPTATPTATIPPDSWMSRLPSPTPSPTARFQLPTRESAYEPSPMAPMETPAPAQAATPAVQPIATLAPLEEPPTVAAAVSPISPVMTPAQPMTPELPLPTVPVPPAATPPTVMPPPSPSAPEMGPIPTPPDLSDQPPQAPTIGEMMITINTADYQSALVPTSPDDPVYPYPRLQHERVGPPSPRQYRAIVLENRYLQLTILPELGGRIYRWVDKASGRNLFYENPVITPTTWGNRGWWLAAGGMEWALPVDEHGLSEASPWDYQLYRSPDIVGVTLSDVEEHSGLAADITISVDATHAYFTLMPKITNPTDHPVSYKFWINGMFGLGSRQIGPGLRFVLPGSQVTVHSTGDTSLPGDHETMDWPIFKGRDFSKYENWRSYLGVFAAPAAHDAFMGAYDHQANLGVVRIFPHQLVRGAKIFAPGDLDPKLWTTDGSNYFELWGGLAPTFWDEVTLEPGQHVTWQEQWYAVGDMGGFNYANTDAALNLGTTPNSVQVAAASTQPINGRLILWQGEDPRPATDWTVLLAPERPFRGSYTPEQGATGPWGLSLVDENGRTVTSIGRTGDDGEGGNTDGSIPGVEHVVVLDRDGQKRDWKWVEQEFGYQLLRAPIRSADNRVFRLIKLQEAEAGPVYVVEVRDAKGKPLSDYLVAQYSPGAPNEILNFANQEWHGFDRATFGYPDAYGNWGIGFGAGAQQGTGDGRLAYFVLSSEAPSDVLARVAPLNNTNYRTLRPTFKLVHEGPIVAGSDNSIAWDPRLDLLGIKLTKTEKRLGQPVFRLVAARFRDTAESQALHHVFVEVIDEGGRRIVGQPVVMAWSDGSARMITEDKPQPEYAANVPMYNQLGQYRVYVEGGASDVIEGLGLPGKQHVSYLLTFQRVK